MTKLTLMFDCIDHPTLYSTEFSHPRQPAPRYCIRGGPAMAAFGCGFFPWTAAVHAFCILAVRSALRRREADFDDPAGIPSLSGDAGSPAACLDLAISKQPAWLHLIFGTDAKGNSLVRHLICRVNPERKRPGPVILSLNPNRPPFENLRCLCGDQELNDGQLERLLATLENSWQAFGHRKRRAAVAGQPKPLPLAA